MNKMCGEQGRGWSMGTGKCHVRYCWEYQVQLIKISCGKLRNSSYSSVQFSHSVVFNSATPWTTARQASLSITDSWSLLIFMSIELVMPSNHLVLCRPLLLLPSIFPASGTFPMSQFFASGGQSIGVSASTSVLPMNIQD